MTAKKYIPSGTVFHFLTYLHDAPSKWGKRHANFRCKCGAEKIMFLANVTSGKSKSCGCRIVERTRERSTTHGMSKTPTYKSWVHMRDRCFNPKDKRYKDYAGRGITVCDRWRNSFENFLSDMGEKPNGLTLDRINNDGNYEPGNCRWATPSQQTENTRRSRFVEYQGKQVRISELAEMSGFKNLEVLRNRIYEGDSVEEALRPTRQKMAPIEFGGISMTPREWEKALGFNKGTVSGRIRQGKTVEQALAPVLPRYRKK